MGFFGTIKDETKRNFIARADEAKGEIVYKYPEKNIRMLTQLTVDADEVALFVKDGKVEGKLGPGRHTAGHEQHPVPVAAARGLHRRQPLHRRGLLRLHARVHRA